MKYLYVIVQNERLQKLKELVAPNLDKYLPEPDTDQIPYLGVCIGTSNSETKKIEFVDLTKDFNVSTVDYILSPIGRKHAKSYKFSRAADAAIFLKIILNENFSFK